MTSNEKQVKKPVLKMGDNNNSANNTCTAWDAWLLVISLGAIEDIANDILEEFMFLLKNNGFLSYKLAPFTKQSTHKAPGENMDIETNPEALEEGEIGNYFSDWESDAPPQDKIVIIMIDHYKASIMVPTRWEYRTGC